MNPPAQKADLPRTQQAAAKNRDQGDALVVGVDARPAGIGVPAHLLGDAPHHPNHAEQMIDVFVGHHDVVDAGRIRLYLLELCQNPGVPPPSTSKVLLPSRRAKQLL